MSPIKIFCFNDFAENAFVIHDQKECIIIDPGCYTSAERDELIHYIEDQNLHPNCILNTHCHIDHVLGVDKIKNHFQIPFIIGKNELPVLNSVKLTASLYGYPDFVEPVPDRFIEENQTIKVGKLIWEVFDVPGHSPGHIALFNREMLICISGDVLFNRSIGRTDLPGGHHEALIKSIKTKIFTLPEKTIVYPGHGPETTVMEEMKYNPFCGVKVS